MAGDIVQLKENGVPKFLKTHVKAVEGLDDEFNKGDTGWVELTLKTNFQGFFKVRRVRNRVTYWFFFSCQGTPGTTAVVVNLPTQFRKPANYSERRGGSAVGSNVQLRWSDNGDVVLWEATPTATNVSGYETVDLYD